MWSAQCNWSDSHHCRVLRARARCCADGRAGPRRQAHGPDVEGYHLLPVDDRESSDAPRPSSDAQDALLWISRTTSNSCLNDIRNSRRGHQGVECHEVPAALRFSAPSKRSLDEKLRS